VGWFSVCLIEFACLLAANELPSSIAFIAAPLSESTHP